MRYWPDLSPRRGVCRSGGRLRVSKDLIVDGKAAMDFLLKRGIKSKHILIHGHSMGAAVGTNVRALYPDGPVISDRSFKSIVAVVEVALLFYHQVRVMAGAVFGSVLSVVYSLVMESDYLMMIVNSLVAGIAGSIIFAIPKLAVLIVSNVIHIFGWSFDVTNAWQKLTGEKMLVYHKLDGVVPHRFLSSTLLNQPISALPSW